MEKIESKHRKRNRQMHHLGWAVEIENSAPVKFYSVDPTRQSDLTSSLKFSEIKNSADAEVMHVAAVRAKAENFMLYFGC